MSQPPPASPPVPRTFAEYLRSFGPGIVVVLTWLGAGDVVEMGVAGGNYGYSLMWVLVLAVLTRFFFVSLIAKYQLLNPHGEGVLDGLARAHRFYPPLLLAAAVVMGHVYAAYFTVGIGEVCVHLTRRGQTWQWALFWNLVALGIVFRPAFPWIERVFKLLLALLAVSFVGTALWVGPSPGGILRGVFIPSLPEKLGEYDSLLIAAGMFGAVAGSLMNLVYPYFLDEKGWRGPRYRRVQMYDFLLAIVVMILLDLAIWTLGAELLHPRGLTIKDVDDLPRLLSELLGEGGRVLFYLGVFAAIFTSIVGHALGLASLGSHAYLRWRAGSGPLAGEPRDTRLYRAIVVWCIASPLVWTVPGAPGFVSLTLVANSAQVVLVPLLVAGIWRITESGRAIGPGARNRWWQNALLAVLFVLALGAAWAAVLSVRTVLRTMGS